MLKPLILRIDKNCLSGYQQLTSKTEEILKKHFDLIVLPIFSNFNKNYTYEKLNKYNWNCPELFISPIASSSNFLFSDVFTTKNNCFLYTMWESTRLTRIQKKELTLFKKILVPSSWNKQNFLKDGFDTHVLNCFVDENIFFPAKNLNSIFSFVTGGCDLYSNTNYKRKDITTLVNIFTKIFRNKKDVELKIKLSSEDFKQRSLLLIDNVKYYDYFCDTIEYSRFLNSCDCFVSMAKAEGWGYMQIESLACGKPLIAPLYSAITEFANETNTFEINYEEELAPNPWGLGGGLWAKINEDSLAEQLINVYNKRDEIRDNYLKYNNSVLPKFSLNNYEKNLVNFLNENYSLYNN